MNKRLLASLLLAFGLFGALLSMAAFRTVNGLEIPGFNAQVGWVWSCTNQAGGGGSWSNVIGWAGLSRDDTDVILGNDGGVTSVRIYSADGLNWTLGRAAGVPFIEPALAGSTIGVVTPIAHMYSESFIFTGSGEQYRSSASPTNTVLVTNRVGLVHVSAASVLSFDFNQSHEFNQTNRSAGAQSIILTNATDGQTMTGILLGEVAGGTSRTMTFIPNTGQLIERVGDYTTGLATSLAVTLTNGLALEWSSKVRRINGTNVHHFAVAFYKH